MCTTLGLSSHGGYRHGSRAGEEDDEEGSEDGECTEQGRKVEREFPEGVRAVKCRAADLILMLVQIYNMSSWFPQVYLEKSLRRADTARQLMAILPVGKKTSCKASLGIPICFEL